MAKIDKKYHDLLQLILGKGKWYEDPNRKGVKRLQIPYYSFEYDLKEGFPAITTKKLYWKGIVGELLWFLKGDTNIKYLVDNGINIWNKDSYNYNFMHNKNMNGDWSSLEQYIKYVKEHPNCNEGDLGRIYGAQWRDWKRVDPELIDVGFDQIARLIQNLKEKPLATDHIVTAWNPDELDQMALPPCHKGFQLMVYELTLEERDKLLPDCVPLEISHKLCDEVNIPKYGFDLVWEQRSVDTFLGLPFNIASYALLAHIIGKLVNMVPGKIYGDLRNVHIYDNAIDSVKEQLSRGVDKYGKCQLEDFSGFKMDMYGDIDNWLSSKDINDFKLLNYKSYPAIKTEMLERDE